MSLDDSTVSTNTPAQTALDLYRAGFTPLRVKPNAKAAMGDGWQNTSYADEQAVLAAFDGHDGNMGVLLSSGLVVIDFDCIEAGRVAELYLPQTGMVIRRADRVASRIYRVIDPDKPRKFQDAVIESENKGKSKEEKERATIAELRISGCRVVGPSIHPDGSQYTTDGLEPATVRYAELVTGLRMTAAAVQLGGAVIFITTVDMRLPGNGRIGLGHTTSSPTLKK